MANLVGPSGHIWAFEPTLKYRRRLEKHLSMNRVGHRVQVVPHGLSDKSRSLAINIDECSATLHPVECKDVPTFESIELRCLDEVVDQLNIKEVDFIKLDIDGHEPQVLAGGEQLIRRCRPAMVIEFSQSNLDIAGSHVRLLKEQIEALGYRLFSDKTGRPYENQRQFLLECGNFTFSTNVWALPREARPSLKLAA